MTTRPDDVQAYRFEQRRMVAALVLGNSQVPETPLRRLRVVTLTGIAIVGVLAAGWALFGLLAPARHGSAPQRTHPTPPSVSRSRSAHGAVVHRDATPATSGPANL